MEIRFGALAPPMSEQMKGLISDSDGELFDKLKDAIVILRVHGMIPDGECHKAHQRILKAIEKSNKKFMAALKEDE